MRRYYIEPRTRKYGTGYGFLSFARKYKKKLLNTGLDAIKAAPKQLVHKAGELIGSKIVDAVTNSNDDKVVKRYENRRNIEEIIIPK